MIMKIPIPPNPARLWPIIWLCLGLLISGSSCSPGSERTANTEIPGDAPHIALSILPQAYFARRIGGDRIGVIVLTGPGQNPHDYEPSPRQMADLAAAQGWILSGAEFEISLKPKIEALFPALRIIDGVAGVQFRLLEEREDHEESGSHEDPLEPGIDRHTWLGREPAKIMATHIAETLISLDEEHKGYYTDNYRALIQDIDDEFDRLGWELAPLRGTVVFVYHPAFGYFFDEFGISQIAVETGGKEPTPRGLTRLIDEAREKNPQVIFVQAQFPVQPAETLAKALGIQVVALDPLAEDWLENIRFMGRALQTMERKP